MRSLRERLMRAFVAPTVLIVTVLVTVAYLAARDGLEGELERRLEAVGLVLSAEMSEGVEAAQLGRLDESMVRVRGRFGERLEAVRESAQVERIFIFDREARTLVDTEAGAVFGAPLYRVEADRREWEEAFEEGRTLSAPLFQVQDGERRYYKTAYAPVFLDGETVAVIGVVAGATYFDLLTGFATVLTLLGVLGVIVVVLVGFWFSALLARPVQRLAEAAGRLAAGELETPVIRGEEEGTKELQFLTGSFEEMRLSILQRDQQMQMMLSGIAHEIRNPLGGMALFCGLLREELEASSKKGQVEMVRKIERELEYLEGVVDEFLAFSRPHQVQLKRIRGEEFLAEIVEVVAGDLLRGECELIVEVAEGLELTVDPHRIRRAVINVIRNAAEACSPGGEVKVSLKASEEERWLEVVDDGVGIEEELLKEVERPFFTTREKGSGLGLSLTKEIVQEHQGSLEIESEAGAGTTIRFKLPFDAEIAAAEKGEEEAGREEIPEGWLG